MGANRRAIFQPTNSTSSMPARIGSQTITNQIAALTRCWPKLIIAAVAPSTSDAGSQPLAAVLTCSTCIPNVVTSVPYAT